MPEQAQAARSSLDGHGSPDERPRKAPPGEPTPLAGLLKGELVTKTNPPRWTMSDKPAMIPGDVVPSWDKARPGPKYVYDTDVEKDKAPVWTMRAKPEMVIGGSVPSWVKAIPGPKYAYKTDVVKHRQPVYSFGDGRPVMKKSASAPSVKAKEGTDKAEEVEPGFPSTDALTRGLNATRNAQPKWNMRSRTKMVIGDAIPSWVNSIPGHKYTWDDHQNKRKPPVWTIRQKPEMVVGGGVPSWTKTIPAPNHYSGAAAEPKKQSLVDSTKKSSFTTSFGVGSRWDGTVSEMLRSGAFARYESR